MEMQELPSSPGEAGDTEAGPTSEWVEEGMDEMMPFGDIFGDSSSAFLLDIEEDSSSDYSLYSGSYDAGEDEAQQPPPLIPVEPQFPPPALAGPPGGVVPHSSQPATAASSSGSAARGSRSKPRGRGAPGNKRRRAAISAGASAPEGRAIPTATAREVQQSQPPPQPPLPAAAAAAAGGPQQLSWRYTGGARGRESLPWKHAAHLLQEAAALRLARERAEERDDGEEQQEEEGPGRPAGSSYEQLARPLHFVVDDLSHALWGRVFADDGERRPNGSDRSVGWGHCGLAVTGLTVEVTDRPRCAGGSAKVVSTASRPE
jgi:hypothetical protein